MLVDQIDHQTGDYVPNSSQMVGWLFNIAQILKMSFEARYILQSG